MIMEFLPPGIEGGVSYSCGHKRPGVDSGTAHIMEDSAAMHKFFDFLSLVQYSTSMTKRFGHGTCKFGHGTFFMTNL
jgi:hypothetical protein